MIIKLQKDIDISHTIQLPIYQLEPQTYGLQSIVLHHGNTVSSGHYKTYIKTDENKWFDCNDERITLWNENELTAAQDKALLLFYSTRN